MNNFIKKLIQEKTKVYDNSITKIIGDYLDNDITLDYELEEINNIRNHSINNINFISNCLEKYNISNRIIKEIIRYVLTFKVAFYNTKNETVTLNIKDLLLIFNDMEIFVSGSFLLHIIGTFTRTQKFTDIDYHDIDIFIFGNIDAREIVNRITKYLSNDTVIQYKITNINGVVYDSLTHFALCDNENELRTYDYTDVHLSEILKGSNYTLDINKKETKQYRTLHPYIDEAEKSTAGNIPTNRSKNDKKDKDEKDTSLYGSPYNNLIYIGCYKYRNKKRLGSIKLNIIQVNKRNYKSYFNNFDLDFVKNYLSINKFVITNPKSIKLKITHCFSNSPEWIKIARIKKYIHRKFKIFGYDGYDTFTELKQNVFLIKKNKYTKKEIKKFNKSIDKVMPYMFEDLQVYGEYDKFYKLLPTFIQSQTYRHPNDINIFGQLCIIQKILDSYETID